MMDLFGKDAEKNFTVLFTFFDYGEPKAVEAVKSSNLTFNASFICNNSVFFEPIPTTSQITIFKEYLKMNIHNFSQILLS